MGGFVFRNRPHGTLSPRRPSQLTYKPTHCFWSVGETPHRPRGEWPNSVQTASRTRIPRPCCPVTLPRVLPFTLHLPELNCIGQSLTHCPSRSRSCYNLRQSSSLNTKFKKDVPWTSILSLSKIYLLFPSNTPNDLTSARLQAKDAPWFYSQK